MLSQLISLYIKQQECNITVSLFKKNPKTIHNFFKIQILAFYLTYIIFSRAIEHCKNVRKIGTSDRFSEIFTNCNFAGKNGPNKIQESFYLNFSLKKHFGLITRNYNIAFVRVKKNAISLFNYKNPKTTQNFFKIHIIIIIKR